MGTKLKKNAETVTDIDGNVYHTVTIGAQTWMVENLKTTKYRNGESIANVTDNDGWNELRSGAYCNYYNSDENGITYGKLYNWFAVNDSRNIAPTGWHVSTDSEWTTLINYLGEEKAGRKLKEAGKSHWEKPNKGATNSSGFTALPGGDRSGNGGTFLSIGRYGHWWSSSEGDSGYAWDRLMRCDDGDDVTRKRSSKEWGLSVRCLRD